MHVRMFHSIISGYDKGLNPMILCDLLDHGLVRKIADGCKVSFTAYAQWSDWAEQTAKATFIARDEAGAG